MPEAAIHKNCKPDPWKHEIRSSGKREISPPSDNATLTKEAHHRQFGLRVSRRTNPRHNGGSLLFGKDIRHDT